MPPQILILSYLALIFFQVVHILEEIACDVFDMQVGPVVLKKNRYLLASSFLTALNILPLALMILGLPAGYYLGMFTSGVIGGLQGIVHTIGFIKTRTVRHSLGVGFYSAIPLSITGFIVLFQLIQNLP